MNLPLKNLNNIISLIENTNTPLIFKSIKTNYNYEQNKQNLELLPLHTKYFIIIIETT